MPNRFLKRLFAISFNFSKGELCFYCTAKSCLKRLGCKTLIFSMVSPLACKSTALYKKIDNDMYSCVRNTILFLTFCCIYSLKREYKSQIKAPKCVSECTLTKVFMEEKQPTSLVLFNSFTYFLIRNQTQTHEKWLKRIFPSFLLKKIS